MRPVYVRKRTLSASQNATVVLASTFIVTKNNIQQASKLPGVSRPTLYAMMKALRIVRDAKELWTHTSNPPQQILRILEPHIFSSAPSGQLQLSFSFTSPAAFEQRRSVMIMNLGRNLTRGYGFT